METEELTTPTVEEARLDKANTRVINYMIASMATGLIPLSFVDLAVLTGVQLKMLHSLANIYGIEFSKNLGKSLIASLLGGVVSVSTATTAASLTKSIPLVGQTTGTITMIVLAGASSYAIGKVFIQHFESGGTFLDFDPETVKAYFAEQFEKGRQLASEFKPKPKEQKADNTEN